MNTIIHNAWDEKKDANKKKRDAQKELRMERSKSAEIADHYLKVEIGLQDFHSNKKGYIKRA